MQIPNTQVGAAPMTFRGQFEPSKDDCDCVAIFDGTSFRLERAAGQVKSLRCTAVVVAHTHCNSWSASCAGLVPGMHARHYVEFLCSTSGKCCDHGC